MTAEQLLEFLERHIDELPQLMGEDDWRAFQAKLHTSVQQMREGMSADALELAVQPVYEQLVSHPEVRRKLQAFAQGEGSRISDSPQQTNRAQQPIQQVVNRFRILTNQPEPQPTDEKSPKTERDNKPDHHPR